MFSAQQGESPRSKIRCVEDMSGDELVDAYLDSLLNKNYAAFGPNRREYQAEMHERGIRVSEVQLQEVLSATKNRTSKHLH